MKTVKLGTVLVLLYSVIMGWNKNFTFENGIVGSKITEMGTTDGRYQNAQVHTGKLSTAFTIQSGSEGFGTWGGIVDHAPLVRYNEIWVRVCTFFPTGFNYNANPWLKFLRIRTATSAGSNLGYDDWYIKNEGSNPPFGFIYEGEQSWHWFGTTGDAIVRNTWETYEMYIKFDTSPVSKGGQARARCWKNGTLIGDINDRITLKSSDAVVNATYLFTYWNGSGPKTQTMYVDDIVVTNETPAGRDVAGNPMVGPVLPTTITADIRRMATTSNTGKLVCQLGNSPCNISLGNQLKGFIVYDVLGKSVFRYNHKAMMENKNIVTLPSNLQGILYIHFN